MIAVIHKENKFEEVMEHFQIQRAEYVVQEIHTFDAQTLYLLLQQFHRTPHKLVKLTGMAV